MFSGTCCARVYCELYQLRLQSWANNPLTEQIAVRVACNRIGITNVLLSSEAEVFIPKVPPRTEFESESESAAETPAMRRTEARDQAEC